MRNIINPTETEPYATCDATEVYEVCEVDNNEVCDNEFIPIVYPECRAINDNALPVEISNIKEGLGYKNFSPTKKAAFDAIIEKVNIYGGCSISGNEYSEAYQTDFLIEAEDEKLCIGSDDQYNYDDVAYHYPTSQLTADSWSAVPRLWKDIGYYVQEEFGFAGTYKVNLDSNACPSAPSEPIEAPQRNEVDEQVAWSNDEFEDEVIDPLPGPTLPGGAPVFGFGETVNYVDMGIDYLSGTSDDNDNWEIDSEITAI